MRGDITIRPETAKDFADIIRLVLRSFSEGTGGDGADVAALIEEIRMSENYIPELSFVAEKGGQTVGHFMFSRFAISAKPDGTKDAGDARKIAMLAPVAVHADHFRQGIGTAMLMQGIERVRQAGFEGITVEGDYHFYNRLGFRTSAEFGVYPTSGFPMTEPRCMMAMELRPGAFAGGGYIVYMYHNA